MTDRPPRDDHDGEFTPEQRARRETMSTVMYWLASISMAGLIVTELAGLGSPASRLIFIVGLFAAGTIAMLLQANRRCPGCGAPYGYALRVLQPNTCRRCGAEFSRLPDD